MSLIYQTDGWLTHREIELPERIFPIDRDLSAQWIRRRYQGPLATYAPVDLNSPDTEFSDFFFVEQGPLQHVDGGDVVYDRTFANVPNFRDEFESTTFTYPAVQVTGTVVSLAITALPAANILTVPGHTFSVNDQIYAFVRYASSLPGTFANGIGVGAVVKILAISGNDLTVSRRFELINLTTGQPQAVDLQSSSIRATFSAGRTNPQVLETQAVIRYEYFLPGVTAGINSPNDIPIEPSFGVVDNTGTITESVTTATTPTAAQYREMILAGELLIDSSTIRPWVGNIFEKVTRQVIAR